jgi:hypothetical protein
MNAVCDGNYSPPCYLIRPRGYRAGCITLLATGVLVVHLLVDCRVSTVLAFYSSRLAHLPPTHLSHLSLSPPFAFTPLPTKTHCHCHCHRPLHYETTSKGVRVAACLECVLDSYARRAQAGGVTVSQQKHLICPASQRLPAAVIVQPTPIATRPILLHSLPNRISLFPSLHQLVAHLVRCPLLSLQIPFAARRLQPALAFSQSCYHQPHHQLLTTHHLDWPASSRAQILQPRRHFCLALLGL